MTTNDYGNINVSVRDISVIEEQISSKYLLENQVDNKYIMEIKIYDSERLP